MNELITRYTVEVLKSEIAAARSEVEATRSSFRYRLGDTLLQALPLSARSFGVIPRVLSLVLTYRRCVRAGQQVHSALSVNNVLAAEAIGCSHLIYNPLLSTTPIGKGVWQTGNLGLLLARLDSVPPPDRLVLHEVTEPVARRLARLQLQGCTIESHAKAGDPCERYAQALIRSDTTGGEQ